MIKDKKIILGITASIAAYKAAYLIRLLVKEGADVQVVMTPAAREFVAPLTFSTLSGKPVLSDFFHGDEGTWNSHVDMGRWADLMLIAPATACTIGKMAAGIADNLLTAIYLSARCAVMVVPAMDTDMFVHPSTERNLETLRSFGNLVLEADSGELASGLEGKGRFREPGDILQHIRDFFPGGHLAAGPKKKIKFSGHKILITAGPTHEAIDPVRFISNHSSGKMGYALAEKCADRGAFVELVTGPTSLTISHKRVKVVHVSSAGEMYCKAVDVFPECRAAILAAAVSDFTLAGASHQKIKKDKQALTIKLRPTRDIAFELGKMKKKDQLLVGFALETENEMENARKKIGSKNLDFIVLNSLRDRGAGFGSDTNKITIIDRNNKVDIFELKDKKEVAQDIIDKLYEFIPEKTP